jgi:hypothetical protein
MNKTKWFRVATEGATTDGRAILRSWIEQMAKNFSPAKYGARVWIEHMRGLLPDSAFAAQGDVLAVKAEAVEDGKLALFAQIKPLESLMAMNKAGQKLYTSIEVDPNFADTGEAYLIGLAVTDSPASLGTELLVFASQNPGVNPLAGRKTNPNTLFTAGLEFQLELETQAPAVTTEPGALTTALTKFTGLMEKLLGTPPEKPAAPVQQQSQASLQDVQEVLAENAVVLQAFAKHRDTDAKALTELQGKFNTLQQAHNDLVTKLSNQSTDPARPPATGGDGYVQSDF